MKTALCCSLGLNCLLLGISAVLLQKQRHDVQSPAPGHLPIRSAEEETCEAIPAPALKTAPAPFNWSSIESSDYRTYIANLRAIRCPEQTICDIVTADVHALYASKLRALETSPVEPRSLADWTRTAAREQLQREESALLASLLASDSHSPSRMAAEFDPPRQKTAVMPLAFEAAASSIQNLEPGQVQAIAQLRERFVLELGGLEQNPSDPAYRQRWFSSQAALDEDLPGFIGGQSFQELQLRAQSATAEPGPGTP
jgi:hypothetical protein